MALKAENIYAISQTILATTFVAIKRYNTFEVLSALIYSAEKMKYTFEKLNIISPEANLIVEEEIKSAARSDVNEAYTEEIKSLLRVEE